MKKGILVGIVGLGFMLSGCCSGLAGKGGPSEFERLHGIYVEKMIPQIAPLMESNAPVDELGSEAYKISAKTAAEVFSDHADVCRAEAEKYIAELSHLPAGALDGYEEKAREEATRDEKILDLLLTGFSLDEDDDNVSFALLASGFHFPHMIMNVSRAALLSRTLSSDELSKHLLLEGHGGMQLFLMEREEDSVTFAERNVNGYFIVETEMNEYGVMMPKSAVWMVERK